MSTRLVASRVMVGETRVRHVVPVKFTRHGPLVVDHNPQAHADVQLEAVVRADRVAAEAPDVARRVGADHRRTGASDRVDVVHLPGIVRGMDDPVATGAWTPAGLPGDLPPDSFVIGYPARDHREWKRAQAVLARLSALDRFLPAFTRFNPAFDRSWVKQAWLWKHLLSRKTSR